MALIGLAGFEMKIYIQARNRAGTVGKRWKYEWKRGAFIPLQASKSHREIRATAT